MKMTILTYQPKITDIMPVKRKYLFRAGIKKFPDTTSSLYESINNIYKLGIQISEPILFFTELPFKDLPVELKPAKFQGVTSITLFVSTLGVKIDTQIDYLFNSGKAMDASLLDAWSSEALECLNDVFDDQLRSKHNQGTMRFSPGYSDISVLANIQFLKILKNDKVQSKKSGALIPRKSTTCMIGWY